MQWHWGTLTISKKRRWKWLRTGILRERMPDRASKSFAFVVTLLMISTTCTFRFPSGVGLDVVTDRAATMQTLCISRVVWGKKGIIFH